MAGPRHFRYPVDATSLARIIEQGLPPGTPNTVKDAAYYYARAFGDRDRDLEDWLQALDRQIAAATGTPSAVVFSYPGLLDAGIESPPWHPYANLTFTFLRLSLRAVASSNHVVTVNINGSVFGTYTLTAGNATVTQAISCPVLTTDAVTMKTVTVADADLSLQLAVV